MKLVIFLLALIISSFTHAQQMPPEGSPTVNVQKVPQPKSGHSKKDGKKASKISIGAGLGLANYFGDLMENNRFFSQPSFSFTASGYYAINKQFDLSLNAGIQQVTAADSKNTGSQFKDRNLSFKSSITDVTVALNWYLLSIKKHGFSPYISAGIGAMFFNPTAEGTSGKQNLRELGTEGQGLAGFPSMYSKSTIAIPLGIGLKIAAGKKVSVLFDFTYRFTGTDYLDDVSSNSYPDKTLLDARNPITAKYTWRGNEVGGETYPTNLKLPRGNPNNKDGYYTTQFRLVYSFKKEKAVKEKEVIPLPVEDKPDIEDRDGDGVADKEDKCPDLKGSAENKGCPLPVVDGGELIRASADSMTYCVFFDLDRANLTPDAFKALNGIIKQLEADKSLQVEIAGYTDNLNTSEANLKLSEERANITKNYLMSYNVPAEKIATSFYGENNPLDEVQQWRNRRVEITVYKK